MDKKREIQYITVEEWNLLNSSIDNLRDKLIINTVYYTGCTVSELIRIRVKDVDFVNGVIHFPAENTKNKTEKFSRIPASLSLRLKEHLNSEGINTGLKDRLNFIFQSNKQNAITQNRVRQLVKHYANVSGIQKAYGSDSKGRNLNAITVHTLRHSHIKHALENNVPLQAIMKQVGHTSIKTTKSYLNTNQNDVIRAYDNSNFDSNINLEIKNKQKKDRSDLKHEITGGNDNAQ